MTGFRADRLHLVREFRGLSQNELASRSGVDVSRINRYEKDGAEPSGRTLAQLADALDVTTDFLLGRDSFDGQPMCEVAVRESFELFVRRVPLPESEHERLRRMTAHERAPQTVADWTALYELTAVGRKRLSRSKTGYASARPFIAPQRRLKAVQTKRS